MAYSFLCRRTTKLATGGRPARRAGLALLFLVEEGTGGRCGEDAEEEEEEEEEEEKEEAGLH